MENKAFLQLLSEKSGVSGHEQELAQVIREAFEAYCDQVTLDPLGNVIGVMKGTAPVNGRIMLAAHMDEIGLIVKSIDENGLVSFSNIGGIDQRNLPCQEVTIHGKQPVYGVIGAKPPHLTEPSEWTQALKMENLLIDTGFTKEEVEARISVGDVITLNRSVQELKNGWLAGKAFDDRAGVVALYAAMKELANKKFSSDLYFVATVQEEIGTRGATTSTYTIQPDIGIAIDVGFGRTPDLNPYDTIELGKGPALTTGPNIHPAIFAGLKEAAKANYLDYQVETAPGHSGTDAWPMQVTRAGVATGVISIPLRYMHTSVETLNLVDIDKTAKLLASFVVSLKDQEMEEFLCY